MAVSDQHWEMILRTLNVNSTNSYVKHLNCGANVCRTVEINLDDHTISFTVIYSETSVSMVKFTFQEFGEIANVIKEVVGDKQNPVKEKAS